MFKSALWSLAISVILAAAYALPADAPDGAIKLEITGGLETDPRDRGRPVALVAGGLGVSPDVFRKAFSNVRPAGAGEQPEPEQVRRNKSVLMEALGPHGITNEQLDSVSNRYRYPPGSSKKWPVRPAVIYAVIEEGRLKSVDIQDGGAGYNSPPQVLVPGHPEIVLEATIGFSRDLEKNGAITEVKAKADRTP